MSGYQYRCAAQPCRHAPDTAIPAGEEEWVPIPWAPMEPGGRMETRHKECLSVQTPYSGVISDEPIDYTEI